jgi:hypothetical protein
LSVFTLGDLKSRVWDRLDQNVELYPSADVTGEINDAIAAWNLFVGEIQATLHVPGFSVAGQIIYATPTGIILPTQVYCEGRQLNRESLLNISRLRRAWQTETTQYHGPVMNFVPIGLGSFAIHPIDHLGGKDIEVRGIAEPVPLVADADYITLPDEDGDSIADLAAVNLIFLEGGKTFADASLLYTRVLSRLKGRMRPGTKLPQYWLIKETVPQ